MVENANNKSMVDIAYEYIVNEGRAFTFTELFDVVKKELGLSDEEAEARISKFYTNLSLDGRIVFIPKTNVWDLKTKHKFDEYHISMKDIYQEIEEEDAQPVTGDDDQGDNLNADPDDDSDETYQKDEYESDNE